MPEDKNWEKIKKGAKKAAKKWKDANVNTVKSIYNAYSDTPGSWPDITRRIKKGFKNKKKK